MSLFLTTLTPEKLHELHIMGAEHFCHQTVQYSSYNDLNRSFNYSGYIYVVILNVFVLIIQQRSILKQLSCT